MRYAHIVFDVDGTLLDTLDADLIGLREVLRAELHLDPSMDALRGVLGTPSYAILHAYGASDADIPRLARLWVEREHDHLDTVRLFPGFAETLACLRARGLRLGIVTSRSREEFARNCAPFGLTDGFDHIVTADDTPEHKPLPAPLLKYMESARANPGDTLYVGDSVYDRDCALGAGVDFALARWGAIEPDMEGPRWRLDRPQDILEILDS